MTQAKHKRSPGGTRPLLLAMLLAWACCAAPAPAANRSAAAATKIGYVLDMVGMWRVAGTEQPLAIGTQLPAGAMLVNESPVSQDYIIVANLNGDVIRTIRCRSGVCGECRTGGGCYDPVRPLPDAPAAENAFATAWHAVQDLFGARPDHYSLHRVRGGGFALHRDGVVPLEGAAIDFTALLEGQEKGVYELRCVEIQREGATGAAWRSKAAVVDLLPGDKVAPGCEGIKPGLFLLRAKHGDESSSAWVLAVPAADFAEWNAKFADFVKKTDTWGDTVPEETKRSYQRAYLEYLNSMRSGQAK
ncbi:MAG TPA: hypothetical protein VMT51_00300 [Dongiaceae bacterium]|nr:hypothetical protein [Dongiaceae bacterium]